MEDSDLPVSSSTSILLVAHSQEDSTQGNRPRWILLSNSIKKE
jgi:hypothetical protein